MSFNPKNPAKYKGTDKDIAFFVSRNRLPTGADYRQPETGRNYSVGTVWQVGKDPTTGAEGDLWMLAKIVSNVAYWVQLSNGGTAFDSFQVQAITAPGVNPVTADITGLVTVNAAAVTNHSVVMETRTRALNAFNVEVQYSAAVASTDATKSGVSHFDSSDFSVDANGFVQLSGSGAVQTITGNDSTVLLPTSGNFNIFGLAGSKTSGSGSTLTVKSPPFSQVGTSATSVLNSGEFVTAAVTRTLPASAGLADGDLFVFVCTTSGALVVQSVSAQKIRIGSLITSAGGTATSTAIGDSLSLRFNATDGFFYAVSVVGVWLIS